MKNLEKATVRWFDNISQEGMIRLASGMSVYVNNDSVTGHILMKGKPLNLTSGQPVMVHVHRDYNWCQVDTLEVIKE